MKIMKRVFALTLAVLMIMALAAPAAAADDPAPQNATYTITIEKEAANRTYVAYQIFTGIVAGNDMLNVNWGKSVTEAGRTDLFEKFAADHHTQEELNVQDVARAVKTEADAKRLAAFLNSEDKNYLGEAAGTFAYDAVSSTYVLRGLDAGYYLIVDKTEVEGEHDAVSAYMMRLVKNVQIKTKDSIPTLEKTVSDINDSTQGTTDTHHKSADYDIGDDVPFHIHIKLGSNLEEYATKGYKMIITDIMDNGLTFDKSSIVVKYGSHTLESDGYVVSDPVDKENGTSTFTITIANLFEVYDANTGEKVIPRSGGNLIIDYTAELNENAKIGAEGNVNKANLEFSNNPTSDGTGKTENDTAIVFTYKLVVNKVDQDNNPLSGAAFTLYKNDINGAWQKVEEFTVGANQTVFSFEGLDDGHYKLEETAHPTGYNAIEPMEFDIVATHSEKLDTLSATAVSGGIELYVEQEDGKFTGELGTTVVNEKGATLPSTGGIGTTIFYVAGGILVCAALVLLVTKKRMSAES